jgi:hypothetical protein
LTSLFGTDYAFSATSDGLPGVTRSFSSFDAAAAEAGQSRIYGGIHFQFDNQGALAAGAALGQYVFQNFLAPVQEDHPQGDDQGGDSIVSSNVIALLAASRTNDVVPSEVVLDGSQSWNAAPPPAGAAPQARAVANGQTVPSATLPLHHGSRQVVDAVFARLDDGKRMDALRPDELGTWTA